jgi:predicted nucleic acid-binding protein
VKRVVVDASALAAVVFEEPASDDVVPRLHRAAIYAPTLLKFELANVAWKTMRAPGADRGALLTALDKALDPRRRIVWHEVNYTDVVLIARDAGISTYDASYVWLAGWLGADLVTLDQQLVAAANAVSAI